MAARLWRPRSPHAKARITTSWAKGLAMSAQRSGVMLDLSEVYDLTPPPILGGPLKVQNITKMDLVVAFEHRRPNTLAHPKGPGSKPPNSRHGKLTFVVNDGQRIVWCGLGE